MIILHDGHHEFGNGETKEDAIQDAIKNCLPQGENEVPVTREWIEAQLEIGLRSDVCGTGLVLEEMDKDTA